MNVASLEFCKELYELSAWGNAAFGYWKGELEPRANGYSVPAYDLGYLLRKLEPAYLLDERYIDVGFAGNEYYASVVICDDMGVEVNRTNYHADTPEDAAAKLAIELFKQGILIKETA